MVENVGWKTTGFPGSKNKLLLGGGFKQILFSSVLGEDTHFDLYFSDGLKPPTTLYIYTLKRS